MKSFSRVNFIYTLAFIAASTDIFIPIANAQDCAQCSVPADLPLGTERLRELTVLGSAIQPQLKLGTCSAQDPADHSYGSDNKAAVIFVTYDDRDDFKAAPEKIKNWLVSGPLKVRPERVLTVTLDEIAGKDNGGVLEVVGNRIRSAVGQLTDGPNPELYIFVNAHGNSSDEGRSFGFSLGSISVKGNRRIDAGRFCSRLGTEIETLTAAKGSSRVFVISDLCHNDSWVDVLGAFSRISKGYPDLTLVGASTRERFSWGNNHLDWLMRLDQASFRALFDADPCIYRSIQGDEYKESWINTPFVYRTRGREAEDLGILLRKIEMKVPGSLRELRTSNTVFPFDDLIRLAPRLMKTAVKEVYVTNDSSGKPEYRYRIQYPLTGWLMRQLAWRKASVFPDNQIDGVMDPAETLKRRMISPTKVDTELWLEVCAHLDEIPEPSVEVFEKSFLIWISVLDKDFRKELSDHLIERVREKGVQIRSLRQLDFLMKLTTALGKPD